MQNYTQAHKMSCVDFFVTIFPQKAFLSDEWKERTKEKSRDEVWDNVCKSKEMP